MSYPLLLAQNRYKCLNVHIKFNELNSHSVEFWLMKSRQERDRETRPCPSKMSGMAPAPTGDTEAGSTPAAATTATACCNG